MITIKFVLYFIGVLKQNKQEPKQTIILFKTDMKIKGINVRNSKNKTIKPNVEKNVLRVIDSSITHTNLSKLLLISCLFVFMHSGNIDIMMGIVLRQFIRFPDITDMNIIISNEV